MKLFRKTLFLFHRDLRLHDNTGLIAAVTQSESVIPCFIFDLKQVGKRNEYRGSNAIQFMLESLQNLDRQLRKKGTQLYLFTGNTEDVIKKLIKAESIDAFFCNKDYTPFSIKRDENIKKTCISLDCTFLTFSDALINEPEAVLKSDNTPYTIFTPFYKRAIKIPISSPQKLLGNNFHKKQIAQTQKLSSIAKKILTKKNTLMCDNGGRDNALKILRSLKKFKNYAQDHDYPGKDATTHLSAHLKFGTVSVREVISAIMIQLDSSPIIRQLYWRDFFTHIAYHSPFVFEQAYQQKYNKLKWRNNKKDFQAWCRGTTGFPIVDAGMRQLITTGFMHNRVRMIVASFLVKDLHIDWRWGEQFFAQHLQDYDPAVNNGNWQWAASTGSDSQPYFRIFNPWLQQKKFDRDCSYIKKWIPELRSIDSKIIHSLYTQKQSINGYPDPIIVHENEANKSKKLYKKCQN